MFLCYASQFAPPHCLSLATCVRLHPISCSFLTHYFKSNVFARQISLRKFRHAIFSGQSNSRIYIVAMFYNWNIHSDLMTKYYFRITALPLDFFFYCIRSVYLYPPRVVRLHCKICLMIDSHTHVSFYVYRRSGKRLFFCKTFKISFSIFFSIATEIRFYKIVCLFFFAQFAIESGQTVVQQKRQIKWHNLENVIGFASLIDSSILRFYFIQSHNIQYAI